VLLSRRRRSSGDALRNLRFRAGVRGSATGERERREERLAAVFSSFFTETGSAAGRLSCFSTFFSEDTAGLASCFSLAGLLASCAFFTASPPFFSFFFSAFIGASSSLATALTDAERPDRFNTLCSPLRTAVRAGDTLTLSFSSFIFPLLALVFAPREPPRVRPLLGLRSESDPEQEPDDEDDDDLLRECERVVFLFFSAESFSLRLSFRALWLRERERKRLELLLSEDAELEEETERRFRSAVDGGRERRPTTGERERDLDSRRGLASSRPRLRRSRLRRSTGDLDRRERDLDLECGERKRSRLARIFSSLSSFAFRRCWRASSLSCHSLSRLSFLSTRRRSCISGSKLSPAT